MFDSNIFYRKYLLWYNIKYIIFSKYIKNIKKSYAKTCDFVPPSCIDTFSKAFLISANKRRADHRAFPLLIDPLLNKVIEKYLFENKKKISLFNY